jgi:hypothetical protein
MPQDRKQFRNIAQAGEARRREIGILPSRPRRGRCRGESIGSLPIGLAFGWGGSLPQRVTLWTAEQERSTAVDIHA